MGGGYPPAYTFTAPYFDSCRPSALGAVSGGGERRPLHPAHTVDRAEALRGEGADQSPGKDVHRSGGAAAGEDPEGDRRVKDERGRAGQALPHRGPH